jgi:quercetin dioxygenase-like cupin family protein
MATQVEVNTNVRESSPFTQGRQSLDRSIWYNGSLMTFLATGEDTEGQFALIEAVNRKGNGPPRHIHHREDETFYVVEGEVTVSVGDRTITATPGTMVFLPRGIPHTFAIESDQARMLVLVTPAGLEGWFMEFGVPAPAIASPPPAELSHSQIQEMLAAAARFGLEFLLPNK